MPDPTPQQLDLFADSRDTMLRNDLIDALVDRDAARAQAGWAALHAEFDDDPALGPARVLVDALARREGGPVVDAGAAQAARQRISAG
ncbi:MAG: hypothetical protein KGL43_26835, partial [Burkholderiales bacterium]|nr:hypothetical protein [Burkholderiales bacterium]